MARPLKKGIDYFPLDVELDDDVQLLKAKQGLEGYAILIELWMKIYKNGFYIKWNEDIQLLFSKNINSEETKVNDVVNEGLLRGLFSKEMMEKYNILTSTGVQSRYFKICKDSKRKLKRSNIKEEYVLINLDEIGVFSEETPRKQGFTPEETPRKQGFTPEESTQRKEKKNKEEKRRKKTEKPLSESEVLILINKEYEKAGLNVTLLKGNRLLNKNNGAIGVLIGRAEVIANEVRERLLQGAVGG